MSTVRNFCVIAASAVAVALMLGVAAVPVASASESCENEARRVEQGSTFLPDCRAYELVSQPYQPSPFWESIVPDGFKLPEVLPNEQVSFLPAVDGNAVLFEGAQANSQGGGIRNNLSRRSPNGWTGENIEPPQSRRGFLCGVSGYEGISQDLQQVAFIDGRTENQVGEPDSIEDCGHEEPSLVPGEPEETGNLFLRDTATGSFQLVNVTPSGTKSYQPWFDAISADGSHVVFNSRAQLTASAPPDPGLIGCYSANPRLDPNEFGNVYVWSTGTVRLLTVLPEGTAVRGTLAGAHPAYGCDALPLEGAEATHALSTDGERVLFYAGGGFEVNGEAAEYNPRPEAPYIDGGLYLRERPGAEQSTADECTEAEQQAEPQKACTLQIDVPEGGSGDAGRGQFQWANAETTKIFFTDTEKLTSDSTAAPGKPDLYEYDLDKPAGERLTDLTQSSPEPADVLGVSGASEDGSYVYFVAQGDLTGAQQNSHGETALPPAQGSGTLSGVAEGEGVETGGSDQVTGLSVANGEFRVGQEIEAQFVRNATVVTACTPDCSAPTELTLSSEIPSEDLGSRAVQITGRGSKEITGVSATSGAFHTGMAISGVGISPGTWITDSGGGTLTLSRGVSATGTQALSATAGNLYLRQAGTTTFIAALPTEADRCNWTTYCLTARVSQSGAYLAFDSFASLTGSDNQPVRSNACSPLTAIASSPCPETFRYAADVGAAGELTCASCNPSGAPPASASAWSVIEQAGRQAGQSFTTHLSDNVSNSGEVFFDTMERLLPADRNETWDVYQYDGGEGESAQLHLISSGESEQPSLFMNATSDGSNLFFVTSQALLRDDTRSDFDLYDARVNGGFATQDEAIQPPSCESTEACLAPLSEPPAEFSAASAALFGAGNLAVAPGQSGVKTGIKKSAKKLTRKQQLERALKVCMQRYRHKPKGRHSCERLVRKRYGAKTNRAPRHHGRAGK